MASQKPRSGPVDPWRECRHSAEQTYTREPCSCGRPLWPPRGRGRGEARYSPRRARAVLRTADALQLRIEGHTYAAIAWRLGYHSPSAAWRAIRRAMERHRPE